MTNNGQKRTSPAPVHDVTFLHERGIRSRVELISLRSLRERPLNPAIWLPTRPSFHVLILFTRGRTVHHIDFEALSVEPGSVLHIRPGQIHAFDRTESNDARLLLFRPEVIPPDAEITAVDPLRPQAMRPSKADFDRLCRIYDLIGSLNDGTSDLDLAPVIEHLLLAAWQVYGQLARTRSGADVAVSTEVRRVRAFERSVEQHLDEHRSVAWHATRIGTSTRTLVRACRQVVGTTPKLHLDRLVALEARRLLAHSDAPIEGVADDLGFSEPSNFTKFFVRVTGLTPRDFRRDVRRADWSHARRRV